MSSRYHLWIDLPLVSKLFLDWSQHVVMLLMSFSHWKNSNRLGFMLGNSSSPSTVCVPVAPRIASILCPSESKLRVNSFRTMCILLINSYILSETRSSVKEIVYVRTILVGSFFRGLWVHTSCLCIRLNFPMYIDKVLHFHILVLLEYLVTAERRRQFKPVLGGTRAAALNI